jgi:hypothetical protein
MRQEADEVFCLEDHAAFGGGIGIVHEGKNRGRGYSRHYGSGPADYSAAADIFT